MTKQETLARYLADSTALKNKTLSELVALVTAHSGDHYLIGQQTEISITKFSRQFVELNREYDRQTATN